MAERVLDGLTVEEWKTYVHEEGQLYQEAIRADLALTGVPVSECADRARQRRVAQLVHEVHDSLVEWGMEPAVATMALRRVSAQSPDERLRILTECAALTRFLPSLGTGAIGHALQMMGSPVSSSALSA